MPGPTESWQYWSGPLSADESGTSAQGGQGRHSSWPLMPSANTSSHLILTANPVRGTLLTALERGQNQLREVKYHAWGPRLVSAELWLKSRSVWHPGPRSFHYTMLGLCHLGACKWSKIFLPCRFLSQSYKNIICTKSVPTWASSLRILGQKGGRAL